jgi:hypothetical protein
LWWILQPSTLNSDQIRSSDDHPAQKKIWGIFKRVIQTMSSNTGQPSMPIVPQPADIVRYNRWADANGQARWGAAAPAAKAMAKAWGKTDTTGFRYLDPHGEAQRGLWLKFRSAMDAISWRPAEQDQMIQAAQATFDAISSVDDAIQAG